MTPGTPPAISPAVKITVTKKGLRLTQHGVVISELRTSVGPTHSVFDVLAALVAVLEPTGRVGVLGFAGGGMMAPLRGLRMESLIESVDLDRAGYDLFRRHCPEWVSGVCWQQADAMVWLRDQASHFSLLLEDLSVPQNGDVFKPEVSWTVLPKLICQRLNRGGIAVFNLLRPNHGRWSPELERVARRFKTARILELDEFENRILVAGDSLPSARDLGRRVREALRRLHSRQAERIKVRSFNPE